MVARVGLEPIHLKNRVDAIFPTGRSTASVRALVEVSGIAPECSIANEKRLRSHVRECARLTKECATSHHVTRGRVIAVITPLPFPLYEMEQCRYRTVRNEKEVTNGERSEPLTTSNLNGEGTAFAFTVLHV